MIQHKIIEIIKSELKNNKSIQSAILYGSFARQNANVNSDIDLGLIICKDFEINNFKDQLFSMLEEFNVFHIVHIKLRNKIAIYFENIPKLEIALLNKIEDLKRNYHGSNIPSDLIDATILFDKTKTVKPFLKELSGTKQKQDTKQIVNDLIDKFIYEFESCSYNHNRSDGYKFYYFYNIAFHIAVQLRYLADGETQFYFLPKNFLVKNTVEKEERESFYELAGSTYLRDGNRKKRKLLDFFYLSIEKLKHQDKKRVKDVLEKIYDRDYLWNFRDVAKFNTRAKPEKIFRTSSPTSYQNDKGFLEFLKEKDINTIIDLRAENEIEKNPYKGNFIGNFNYIKAPFDPWNQPDWFIETQHYGTNTEIAYRFFVMACRDEVKKIFNAIYETEEAVVIHCLAGKDRTGFVILLINMLIDTPYDVMLNDYLASELDAEESKFKIYYDNIISEGGILKYLKSCGINQQEINEIKKKLKK